MLLTLHSAHCTLAFSLSLSLTHRCPTLYPPYSMVSKQAKQKDGEIVSHIQNARTSIRAGKNKAPEKPEGGTVFSSTNNGDPRAPTRVDKLAGDDNPPSFADIVGKAAGGIGGFGGFGGGGGDGPRLR